MKRHCLLPDISQPGRIGCSLPDLDVPSGDLPPEELLRQELELPEVSEVDLVRYFTALSKLNYGVDTGFYPLGSCTMKYNPKSHEDIARLPGFTALHPCQPEESVQGALELMYRLQEYLTEVTGMDATSLAPLAGAHGELAGLLMLKAYHEGRGDKARTKILLTDSSHGTNPASVAMCGLETGVVASDASGDLGLKNLESMMTEEVAALTLTMPSTLGLFDPKINEIAQLVHERGGLLGGDGANLNALLGQAKFGELGFDYVQLNLHKTFSTPHGGGGPGSGPVCVRESMVDFLPTPLVTEDNGRYRFSSPPRTIGRIATFHGNFNVMVKAYAYARSLGPKELKRISEDAVLNANYLKEKLKPYYHLPYDRTCMHEVVFSAKKQKAKGIATLDIAKRLLDYGLHPPTVYFPLIVSGALMTEPTETESKETLDNYIAAMKEIARDAEENPAILHTAPRNTPVRRLDDARAFRQLDLRWEIKSQKK